MARSDIWPAMVKNWDSGHNECRKGYNSVESGAVQVEKSVFVSRWRLKIYIYIYIYQRGYCLGLCFWQWGYWGVWRYLLALSNVSLVDWLTVQLVTTLAWLPGRLARTLDCLPGQLAVTLGRLPGRPGEGWLPTAREFPQKEKKTSISWKTWF